MTSKISTLLTADTPTYNLTLPLSKKEVTFRPFRVKEEKILLLAMESDDPIEMYHALKNLIDSCSGEDSGSLPIVDIEYLFINIRARSIGEIVEPVVNCPITNKKIPLKVDLTKVKPPSTKNILDNNIKISENVGVTLRYPTLNSLIKNKVTDAELLGADSIIQMVASCIEEIYTKTESFKCEDIIPEEIVEFVESMSSEHFEQVSRFFESIPSLEHKVKYYTPKEDGGKEQQTVTLSGLSDFFG